MTTYAERTHPGRRSGDNEDATGVNAERQWYFVADGMGGQGNGRVASLSTPYLSASSLLNTLTTHRSFRGFSECTYESKHN